MGVIIFYIVFTVVYGLMHALVFVQAAPFVPQGPARLLTALFFLAMAVSPVATGLMGLRSGPVALAVYAWMGLTFYLFMGSLVLLPVRFLAGAGVYKVLFMVMAGVSLAACAWGLVHARDVAVKRVVVSSPRLEPGSPPVRLAVLSDMHLWSVEQGGRLDRVLPLLEVLEYDVLVSLGDLVEAGFHHEDWAGTAARLAAVEAPLGKYAVTGNHEHYADMTARTEVAEAFHQAAGFRMLDNEVLDVGRSLRLAGLDYAGPDADAVAAQLRDMAVGDGRAVAVLRHEPEVDPPLNGLFDIQLSGHSHAGQIWPFTIFVRWRFPYLRGRYALPGGGSIYVSEGTGTWGPPMRVCTQAEITLVELVPAQGTAGGGDQ